MQNKRGREWGGSATSRSIFYTRIIFCFTDLSLNNSCCAGARAPHCREDEKKIRNEYIEETKKNWRQRSFKW
jgi:hypothetical protein